MTLYPGNVATLRWDLEPIIIVLGILVHPETGEPLGDLVIEGTRGVTASDPDGYFQGEVRGLDKPLHARVAGERCRISLRGIDVRDGVARLGRIACKPVSPESAAGENAPATPR